MVLAENIGYSFPRLKSLGCEPLIRTDWVYQAGVSKAGWDQFPAHDFNRVVWKLHAQ